MLKERLNRLHSKIQSVPPHDLSNLEERLKRMKERSEQLQRTLATLPADMRKAASCVLCKEIEEVIFCCEQIVPRLRMEPKEDLQATIWQRLNDELADSQEANYRNTFA